MGNKNLIKIFVNIIMTFLFILLLNPFKTGLVFHEIIGLSIILVFLIHLMLNWPWVKNVSKNLFSSRINTSVRIKYFLNFSLLLCIITIVVTGVLISKILFSSIALNIGILSIIHKWVSYFCLGLFVAHVAFHLNYLKVSFIRFFSHVKDGNVKKMLLRFGAVLMLITFIYGKLISGISEAEANKYQILIEETNSAIETYKEEEKEKEITTIIGTKEVVADKVTLEGFLKNLYCTGCSKHCSLLYPQCRKATPQITAAKVEYQKLYGETT